MATAAKKKFEPAEINGVYHDEDADLQHVGGYSEVTMKEVHSEQNEEDYEHRTLCFVMEDPVGNKRVCRVGVEQITDALTEAEYKLRRM